MGDGGGGGVGGISDTALIANTASLLPSNRFHGQLTSIPKGWLRKVVTTSKGFQQVFYYNPVGKRFSCQEEIDQSFARLGYSVPVSLFNFELPKLVDEEDEEDDVDDFETTSSVTGNGNNSSTNDETNAMVVKVTSNAKGEATVTPTTSTYVALPSGMTAALPLGTIVTRADTTVDFASMAAAAATSAHSASLVTSSSSSVASKQQAASILVNSAASKVMLAKTST